MADEIKVEQAGVSIAGQTLLSPVSFSLAQGRTLAVVGANGSGKTTLLRVLAGTMRASRGTVRLAGKEPDEREPAFRARVAAQIGMPALARNLTLREYLVLVGASWGSDVDAARRRADALLEEFGIARLAHRFPHELSSGQTRMYVLALTFARPSSVLLVDEPEQRLDPDRLVLVGDALVARQARGMTIVMASHSTSLVERVAHEVLTLIEGDAGAAG